MNRIVGVFGFASGVHKRADQPVHFLGNRRRIFAHLKTREIHLTQLLFQRVPRIIERLERTLSILQTFGGRTHLAPSRSHRPRPVASGINRTPDCPRKLLESQLPVRLALHQQLILFIEVSNRHFLGFVGVSDFGGHKFPLALSLDFGALGARCGSQKCLQDKKFLHAFAH